MEPKMTRIVVAFGLTLFSSSAFAQLNSVNWNSLPYTPMSTFEEVDSTGLGTYPADGYPIRMIGVLLNNPSDMLDSTPDFNTTPFDLGGQWQVFVQTTLPNDFGGVALYMGQNYGNIPPALTFDPNPTPDPTQSFSNAQWQAEVNRLDVDQATGHVFQAGDLVEIDAEGGLFYGGKTNVNDEHSTSPTLDFQMKLIQANYGLPTPTPLTLASIWDQSTNSVAFDPTRETGGEHYQGTLVNLEDVHLVSGTWGANELVMVADTAGHELPVQLGLNAEFNSMLAPTGWFNIKGIFDQETSPSGPYTNGYQLYVTDPTWIHSTLLGDLNHDGFVGQSDLDTLLSLWGQHVLPGSTGDIQGNGFIGQGDLDTILSEWGQSVPTGNGVAIFVPEVTTPTLVGMAMIIFGLAVRWHRRAMIK